MTSTTLKAIGLGIDLGAATVKAAILPAEGVAHLIDNGAGSGSKLPAVLGFRHDRLLFGEEARAQAASHGKSTLFGTSLMRVMCGNYWDSRGVVQGVEKSTFVKLIAGQHSRAAFELAYMDAKPRPFCPEELAGLLLRHAAQLSARTLGRPVKNIVMSVPNAFTLGQRQALRDAAVIAELNCLRLVNATSLAAMAFALSSKTKGESKCLFLDIGASSTNVGVASIDDGVIEVHSSTGDLCLGGDDIDALLVNHCLAEFKSKHGKDLSTNERAMLLLRQACEQAKIALSKEGRATVEVKQLHEGRDFATPITRAQLDKLCEALWARVLATVDRAFYEGRRGADGKVRALRKGEITRVVLLGGSTASPRLRELVSRHFGDKVPLASFADGVARGAAVQAHLLTGGGNPLMKDLLLIDSTAHAYGLLGDDGKTVEVIPSFTTIPCKMYRVVKPKSGVKLLATVVQGQDDTIPRFFVRGAGDHDVVTAVFDIDPNGNLSVGFEPASAEFVKQQTQLFGPPPAMPWGKNLSSADEKGVPVWAFPSKPAPVTERGVLSQSELQAVAARYSSERFKETVESKPASSGASGSGGGSSSSAVETKAEVKQQQQPPAGGRRALEQKLASLRDSLGSGGKLSGAAEPIKAAARELLDKTLAYVSANADGPDALFNRKLKGFDEDVAELLRKASSQPGVETKSSGGSGASAAISGGGGSASAAKPAVGSKATKEAELAALFAELDISDRVAEFVSQDVFVADLSSLGEDDLKSLVPKIGQRGRLVRYLEQIRSGGRGASEVKVDLKLYKGPEDLKTATSTLTQLTKDALNPKAEFWEVEKEFKAHLNNHIEDYTTLRAAENKKMIVFRLAAVHKVSNPVLESRFAQCAKRMADGGCSAVEVVIVDCCRLRAMVCVLQLRERYGFHGTHPLNIKKICDRGLLRVNHPLNPSPAVDEGYFGKPTHGVYTSQYADYTLKYSNNLDALKPGESAQVVMLRMLPGKTRYIEKRTPGLTPDSSPGCHSHISSNQQEWYLFSEDQVCPAYVLTVAAFEDTRTASDDM